MSEELKMFSGTKSMSLPVVIAISLLVSLTTFVLTSTNIETRVQSLEETIMLKLKDLQRKIDILHEDSELDFFATRIDKLEAKLSWLGESHSSLSDYVNEKHQKNLVTLKFLVFELPKLYRLVWDMAQTQTFDGIFTSLHTRRLKPQVPAKLQGQADDIKLRAETSRRDAEILQENWDNYIEEFLEEKD